MTTLLDIAKRDDVHGATARAMLYALRIYAPQLEADEAADAVSKVPLLGDRDSWRMPIIADDPKRAYGEPGVLETCSWRARQDSHCRCFRCGSQGIELAAARAIIAPCAPDRSGCYWCRSVMDPSSFADGIIADAIVLACKGLALCDAVTAVARIGGPEAFNAAVRAHYDALSKAATKRRKAKAPPGTDGPLFAKGG